MRKGEFLILMKRMRSFIIIIALFLYAAGCSPGTIPDQETQPPAAEQGYSIHQELADLIAAKKERASARPTGLEEKPIKEESPKKEDNSKPEPVGTPRKEAAEQPVPQKPELQPQPKPKPEKEEEPPEKPKPEPQPARFEEEEALLIQLANEARAAAGRNLLVVDPTLCAAARAKSQDMADNNKLKHDSPKYPFPQILDIFDIKYRWAGENIALSKPNLTPEAIHNRWLDSEGHKKTCSTKRPPTSAWASPGRKTVLITIRSSWLDAKRWNVTIGWLLYF